MERNVVALRQMQRNYRKLIDEVKRTKRPLYLGARLQPEAVLLDVGTFERMQAQKAKKMGWSETKRRLDWIANGGRQNVDLSKFIHEDRKRH